MGLCQIGCSILAAFIIINTNSPFWTYVLIVIWAGCSWDISVYADSGFWKEGWTPTCSGWGRFRCSFRADFWEKWRELFIHAKMTQKGGLESFAPSKIIGAENQKNWNLRKINTSIHPLMRSGRYDLAKSAQICIYWNILLTCKNI